MDSPEEFDPFYYIRVRDIINNRSWISFDKWYIIDDYTDTPEKLIFHLKYYIDRQKINDIMITLSDDLRTKFKVEAPFVDNISAYGFQLPKLPEPILQPAAGTTIKRKDPFANLRPVVKQGEIF